MEKFGWSGGGTDKCTRKDSGELVGLVIQVSADPVIMEAYRTVQVTVVEHANPRQAVIDAVERADADDAQRRSSTSFAHKAIEAMNLSSDEKDAIKKIIEKAVRQAIA